MSGTELGARERRFGVGLSRVRSVRGFGALWLCESEFSASFSCVGGGEQNKSERPGRPI